MAAVADDDEFANPLSRKRPLGGRTGVAIASVVPVAALIVFLVLGFAFRAWNWAWVVFLVVPIVGIAVYGLGGRPDRRN